MYFSCLPYIFIPAREIPAAGPNSPNYPLMPPITPDHMGPPILKPLPRPQNPSPDTPPPIPPRSYNQNKNCGELSPCRPATDAPVLPPRNQGAPPVPPRRDPSQQTLPRAQSMNIPRQQIPVTSMTLPRRNSERDQQVSMNVNGSDTPELPPKTYRVTHSRKQSS